MNSHGSSTGPPACEFDSDKLILLVDALVESRIEALSPVVDRLMHVLKKTCCPTEQEFAVETALPKRWPMRFSTETARTQKRRFACAASVIRPAES